MSQSKILIKFIMILPDQAVKEFKEIYEKKFEKKLTDGEYRIRAEKFLRLMKLITSPIPKQKPKNNKLDLFTKNLAKTLLDQVNSK